ncbi:hypothetical protein HK096_010397 [Nowakowskiella sp. JEL0078]|nr:hypothetical protein HK096_010397 [Nowakowskiella sp. JEL0078]
MKTTSPEVDAKPVSISARYVAMGIVNPNFDTSETKIMKAIYQSFLPPQTRDLLELVLDRWPVDIALQFQLFVGKVIVVIIGLVYRLLTGKKREASAENFHVPLRKRLIYDSVIKGITHDSVKQVIILGSGFDVLCLQLAKKYPDVLFVEVDHPNMIVTKKKAVGEIYELFDGVSPANHVFLDVDFRSQSVEEQLKNKVQEWKSNKKSMAISEGVWMYLTKEEIRASLRDFKRISSPGSKIVFHYHLKSVIMSSVSPVVRYLMKLIAAESFKYMPETDSEIEELVSFEGFDVEIGEPYNCYNRYIHGQNFEKHMKKYETDLSHFFGVATSIEKKEN